MVALINDKHAPQHPPAGVLGGDLRRVIPNPMTLFSGDIRALGTRTEKESNTECL